MTTRHRDRAAALALLLVAACAGLPERHKEQAEQVPARIAAANREVAAREEEHRAWTRTPAYAPWARVAARERWSAAFAAARAETGRATALAGGEMRELLDDDFPRDSARLAGVLASIDSLLLRAREEARRPALRTASLDSVRRHAPEVVGEARRAVAAARAELARARPAVARARAGHPARRDELDARLAALDAREKAASAPLARAEEELGRHRRGADADYAVLGDSARAAGNRAANLAASAASLREKVAGLYESRVRVVTDLRLEHTLVVGRTSYIGYSDSDTDEGYIYAPVELDDRAAEYFSGLADDASLATCTKGTGTWTWVHIDMEMWNSLSVDCAEGWPYSNHDEAVFWVNEIQAWPFVRYTDVVDGEARETGWVAVDMATFDELSELLGMEVESKPRGAFPEEASRHPAPAGMSLVGDPQTGRWATGPDGATFWEWNGRYAALRDLAAAPAARGEWEAWNRGYRGRRAYLGRDEEHPDFGTRGRLVLLSPRYGRSEFARRGGLQGPVLSLRDAGPRSRGRGPGGGGK